MHSQELSSLPFAAPIIFLQLLVPCIGFLFPSALLSRLLLSLSRHYKIINLPIFVIFSLPIVPLVHLALLTSIFSLFLFLNLPKLVDLSFLLLQLFGILFLLLSVLPPQLLRFIPVLRLIFSPLDLSSPLSVTGFLVRHRVCLFSESQFVLSAWMA